MLLTLYQNVSGQSRWKAGLLAFFGGVLGVLGQAPFHFWPAFVVSICILFALLDGAATHVRKLRAAFFRAWCWAFGYFVVGMFWIGNAFLVDADKFALLMPFAVSGLPAFLALYWGLAGVIFVALWRQGVGRLLTFACVFALAEFARGHLFTGLPWNLPAYGWKPGEAISQFAAVVGPYGLSLLTLLLFGFPVAFLTETRPRIRLTSLLLCIAGLSGVYGYGMWRLTLAGPVNSMAGSGPIISTGQAGFSQKDVWNPANTRKVTQTYLDLLDSKDLRESDIIVWPEGAFPFLLLEQTDVLAEIENRLKNRILAVGSIREEVTMDENRYFNSLVILENEQGSLAARVIYDKYHLVPFGEYLPFRKFFSVLGIQSLVSYGGDIRPGPSPSIIAVPKAPRADARICYEIVFPSFHPNSVDQAGWILNASIDAWYGDILGPDQHYAQARYRAIETGLPLVRSASGGWSAIVDHLGRPLAEHRFGKGFATARLPLVTAETLYFQLGESIFVAFVTLLLGFALFRRFRD